MLLTFGERREVCLKNTVLTVTIVLWECFSASGTVNLIKVEGIIKKEEFFHHTKTYAAPGKEWPPGDQSDCYWLVWSKLWLESHWISVGWPEDQGPCLKTIQSGGAWERRTGWDCWGDNCRLFSTGANNSTANVTCHFQIARRSTQWVVLEFIFLTEPWSTIKHWTVL